MVKSDLMQNYELWWSEPHGNNLKAILDAVGIVGEGLEQLSALFTSQYESDIEGFNAFLAEYQGLLKSMGVRVPFGFLMILFFSP